MVGTGASAIQIVPKIQPEVKRLVLFQRTPAWIVPRRDRRITEFEKRLYRQVPVAQRLARLGIYLSRESMVGGFTKRPGDPQGRPAAGAAEPGQVRARTGCGPS